MKSSGLKSSMLAGLVTGATVTTCMAQVASGYWVVGNAAIHTCEIVTSNPVIDYVPGSFGTGPYQSRADANLARATIGACPKEDSDLAGVYRLPEESESDDGG
jgi:heme A synthase